MTPLDLMDALKAYIEKQIKDIILPVKVDPNSGKAKERAAEVYKMRLPAKTAQTERIPYVLVQYLKSKDTQSSTGQVQSICTIRIIAATYSRDEQEGSLCVANLLTRIKMALLRDRIIAERFLLEPNLETIIYPDDTGPYYLGEMMTEWKIPIMEREVQKTWM